jgi:hypothetical protein
MKTIGVVQQHSADFFIVLAERDEGMFFVFLKLV